MDKLRAEEEGDDGVAEEAGSEDVLSEVEAEDDVKTGGERGRIGEGRTLPDGG